MTSKHFHILSRVREAAANGKTLSGDIRHLSARDVRMALDGTPYAEQAGIAAVLDSGLDMGYAIPPDAGGWVGVTACTGADQQQCHEVLMRAAVGGDIRLQKAIVSQESDHD